MFAVCGLEKGKNKTEKKKKKTVEESNRLDLILSAVSSGV